jgi:hypothetical protein
MYQSQIVKVIADIDNVFHQLNALVIKTLKYSETV